MTQPVQWPPERRLIVVASCIGAQSISRQPTPAPTLIHNLKTQRDLSYNQISGTLSENFTRQPNLIDLYLAHNRLTSIDERAFVGLNKLQVLQLNHNLIQWVHPAAFVAVRASLVSLDLSSNQNLVELGADGLDHLATFSSVNNPKLRYLPHLLGARDLALTYAYHCCDYLTDDHLDAKHMSPKGHSFSLTLVFNWAFRLLLSEPPGSETSQTGQDRTRHTTASWLAGDNLTETILWPSGARQSSAPTSSQRYTDKIDTSSRQLPLQCRPQPSAFMPCRDLFDTWWLRVGVWCVFLLAFAGNFLVIVVLCSVRQSSSASALTSIMWLAHSKRHIDVPRFLVINLAVADLLMAVYLGVLAFVDLSTLGEFKVFAIKWQHSSGCKAAGFLGVLSSELSVFILAIITLERNYAITNAVHLNRRLSLQKAALIMLLGYTFALSMAVLPLQGVNDYTKYSICLPLEFDQADLASQVYIWTLLSINTLSFILLLSCYLRMYCAIRGSQAWNTNDLRIARRMSILVVTDFLCWTPIIFTAISSLLGHHLVGTQGLKTLTIFILPLNSIANPFLYAITTKKFKRDLRTLKRKTRNLTSILGPARHNLLNGQQHMGAFSKQQDNLPGRKLIDGQLLALTKHERTLIRATKGGGAKKQQQQHQRQLELIDNATTNRANQVTLNKTSVCCTCMRQLQSQQQPMIVLELGEPTTGALRQVVSPEPVGNLLRGRLLVRKSLSMQGAIETTPEVAPDPVQSRDSPTNFPAHPEAGVPSAQHLSVDVIDFQANRSASACGYRQVTPVSSNPTVTPATVLGVSYDGSRKNLTETMRRTTKFHLSGSINRLLFEPLAKAWSSIHISLNSSASHVNLAPADPGEAICECSSVKERNLASLGCVSSASTREGAEENESSSNYLDDILLLSSPLRRLHAQRDRRMSRSCDLLVRDSSVSMLSSSACVNQDAQTATSTTQVSQEDDDRRILLATINRLAGGRRGPDFEQILPKGRYLRNKCTRCRSWSPALLGKLEDCIHQIKTRLTNLSASTRHQTHEERGSSDTSREAESNSTPLGISLPVSSQQPGVQGDSRSIKQDETTSEEEDDFDEFALERQFKQQSQQRRQQHLRRLQTQSSTTSDSLSTRTAGTLATTMSVSFDSNDESNTERTD